MFEGGSERVPAATFAAQRVAEVRDRPEARLDLLRSSYAPPPGAAPRHLRYQRAALAFMGWQLRRGLLNPPDHERPGSPWWRAVNERLLRDTCEARSRLLGHPGPASTPSVEWSVRFARQPSPRSWYLAHNVTIRAPPRPGLAGADRPTARRSAARHDRHVPLGVTSTPRRLPARR
jgi:hypothetical protein